MRLYVVYHIKGNRSPSDIILEISVADLHHTRPTRPNIQGPVGPPHWKWTERNIGVVKERIMPDSCRPFMMLPEEIVLYSVRQIF